MDLSSKRVADEGLDETSSSRLEVCQAFVSVAVVVAVLIPHLLPLFCSLFSAIATKYLSSLCRFIYIRKILFDANCLLLYSVFSLQGFPAPSSSPSSLEYSIGPCDWFLGCCCEYLIEDYWLGFGVAWRSRRRLVSVWRFRSGTGGSGIKARVHHDERVGHVIGRPY